MSGLSTASTFRVGPALDSSAENERSASSLPGAIGNNDCDEQ
jgi:hypothetical protein